MDMAPLVPDLQEGRYLCLTFMDDGCGMNKQTLERIFDPFFTTKAVGEGAGLGLSVVHGIVRSHDGAISVYSIPNLGTTFKLYFPALSTETSSPQIFQSAVPRGSGERILYVDDEESLVLMATRMLRRLGYEVTGYSDPWDALRAFRSQPERFDVVITDLSMPGMSGFDLAQSVLAARADTPIVMTSGFLREEDHRRAAQIGIRALIFKPNTVDALAPVVHQLVSDRRRFDLP
jgi:CheY-like chemotaxis protein